MWFSFLTAHSFTSLPVAVDGLHGWRDARSTQKSANGPQFGDDDHDSNVYLDTYSFLSLLASICNTVDTDPRRRKLIPTLH
jgi:hypothetical protein